MPATQHGYTFTLYAPLLSGLMWRYGMASNLAIAWEF
jgi:hypothetical protein